MNKALSRGQFWGLTLTGTVAFFAFWYLARVLHFSPPQFLPMPHEVLFKLIELMDTPFAGATLPEHLYASFKRFGMGFGLAALVGIPLGLSMGWFRWLDDVVTPLFDAVRFIFAGAFPPCLINAYRGARNVEVRFLEAASMLGVGSFKTITEVLFPAAVPSIIAGLRIGAGLGWLSLVGAELIVASSGMGNLIVRAQSALATDTVMVGMIAIGAVGVVIDILIRRVEKLLLKHRNA
jgi:NitT/TauT family transport system permease protein